jgi:hypothetical protein
VTNKQQRLEEVRGCSKHLEILYTLGKMSDLALFDVKVEEMIEALFDKELDTYELSNKRLYTPISALNKLTDRSSPMSSSYRTLLKSITPFWESISISPREYRSRSNNPHALPMKQRFLISMPEALLILLIGDRRATSLMGRAMDLSLPSSEEAALDKEDTSESSAVPDLSIERHSTSISIEPFSIKMGSIAIGIGALNITIRSQ